MRVISILTVAANIAWFGGLLRLLGEAIARLLELASTVDDRRNLVVFMIASVVFGAVMLLLLRRWGWYRDLLRQNTEAIKRYSGVPVPEASSSVVPVRRAALSFGMVILPALAVAIILPGPTAAAIALLAGLVLRLGLAAVLAARGT